MTPSQRLGEMTMENPPFEDVHIPKHNHRIPTINTGELLLERVKPCAFNQRHCNNRDNW